MGIFLDAFSDEIDFFAVFTDKEGHRRRMPANADQVANLIGFLVLDKGWRFLHTEDWGAGGSVGKEGEENSGMHPGSVG